MLMSDPQPNDAFTWTQESWGRALRCTRLKAPHLFTSRDLFLKEDQGEWKAAASSLGVPVDRLLLIKQIHGIHVAVKRAGQNPGWTRPEADVIITEDPLVAIGVRVADCAPVLLYDPSRGAVGAAHAGWRGTASGAAASAVRAMQKEFRSQPANLIAAIGPCLGACCGEVGPEVIEAFRAGGAGPASIAAWFTPGTADRSFLDLERANRDQLIEAGLDPEAVFVSGLCTKTHQDRLHSYRGARSAAGRMLGAIRCP
jgi:YfiH family protein